ncbi:hypothetical protein F4677DRAFT_409689, partial [Hypoxylon crocopeplum]
MRRTFILTKPIRLQRSRPSSSIVSELLVAQFLLITSFLILEASILSLSEELKTPLGFLILAIFVHIHMNSHIV